MEAGLSGLWTRTRPAHGGPARNLINVSHRQTLPDLTTCGVQATRWPHDCPRGRLECCRIATTSGQTPVAEFDAECVPAISPGRWYV